MKKKIKDLTIEDMINICNSHRYQSCLTCKLFDICMETPQYLVIKEDINKEIDL